MSERACKNTDREIWRGPDAGGGDFYADSLHITEAGALGINCGGYVIVRPLREWHKLAGEFPKPPYETECDHPTINGKPCVICATHYAPAEAARINALADDYKRGLDKMVASGYEEFGVDALRNHATVIKALRACAESQRHAPLTERWTITSRRKLRERIYWAWSLLFCWPSRQ